MQLANEHLWTAGRPADFVGPLLEADQNAQLFLYREPGRLSMSGLLPLENIFAKAFAGHRKSRLFNREAVDETWL